MPDIKNIFNTVKRRLTAVMTLIGLALVLAACVAPLEPYRAYEGEVRSESQLAMISGAHYARQDWINRYIHKVRISSVNGQAIENSERIDDILVTPGTHEISVYFSWDTGSQRGLAPALIEFVESQDTLRRDLQLTVDAGQRYYVRASLNFTEDGARDITQLTHVDFWVEDESGNMVVSLEEGRYVPTN